MRMRKKPNLIPRMERCSHVEIKDPANFKGIWLKSFPGYKHLWLELGCGKGKFTVETAVRNPDALIIAIEKVPDAMVVGMERACDCGIENVRFISADALALPVLFDENEIDRIFINFCDPWPRKKEAKHRLTSPGFLEIYSGILKPEGDIHFKTDNCPLFEYSLDQFTENGWAVSELTRDLHGDGPVGVMTDYEARFYEQGVKINRLAAKKEARQ